VTALLQRARTCLDAGLTRASDDVTHTRARLLALSPATTLRRGYAIVQHADDGVVRAASEVTPGESLTVRFATDQLTVLAKKTGPPKKTMPARKTGLAEKDGQAGDIGGQDHG
jgi:exodeoxyribonuclease VII large subunit